MKILLFFVISLLFQIHEAKAETDPEFGVPKYVIRTRPDHLSPEDASFLFKNQEEQLLVTFVEREREYARFFNIPIFPKKAWDIRYERAYMFDGSWNIVYENEVSREKSHGQLNIFIALFLWSFLVLFIADRISDNGIFGKKDRQGYHKETLGAGTVFLLIILVFIRFLNLFGLPFKDFIDTASIALIWGAFVVYVLNYNYKVPKQEKRIHRSIGV